MTSVEAKYDVLLNILDHLVLDGAGSGRKSIYLNATQSPTKRDQARARAYIHLFLEARYGLHEFDERESQITDSSYDGGIDAFHIDHENRMVVLVQSKFRLNAQNFSDKHIGFSEISRIDAEPILRGEEQDAAGNRYSGHITGFQRRLKEVPNIARYRHSIVLLANVRADEQLAVQKLFPDIEVEIYDFERCYEKLVMPVLRGEQTYCADLQFNIDMSNKSAGSRMRAEVRTEHGPVDITVILAPTIEIAQLMSKYRNSILRFNPRSYLEFSQQTTNWQIRESIVNRASGEFALLNNGITMLSDETFVSERTGQKGTAQVSLRNPQIINGGQTAFTLSRIWDAASDIERSRLFEDKEVVVRIITLSDIEQEKRLELIHDISSATNSQTQVVTADRVVANDEQRELVRRVFMSQGLLYEHKRGEYADALLRGFVRRESIVERSLFLRLMQLAGGQFEKATRAKSVKKGEGFRNLRADDVTIKRFGTIYSVYRAVTRIAPPQTRQIPETLAVIEAVMVARDLHLLPEDIGIERYVVRVEKIWPTLVRWSRLRPHAVWQGKRPLPMIGANTAGWAKTINCPVDIRAYLNQFGLTAPEELKAQLKTVESSSPGRSPGQEIDGVSLS